jgi:hypothetical protein
MPNRAADLSQPDPRRSVPRPGADALRRDNLLIGSVPIRMHTGQLRQVLVNAVRVDRTKPCSRPDFVSDGRLHPSGRCAKSAEWMPSVRCSSARLSRCWRRSPPLHLAFPLDVVR